MEQGEGTQTCHTVVSAIELDLPDWKTFLRIKASHPRDRGTLPAFLCKPSG